MYEYRIFIKGGNRFMDREDLVCICKSVSYGQIEEAIHNGAQTYEDILEETEAGSVCGGCIERIDEILDRLVIK